MENPPNEPKQPKQICTITIAFPIDSDVEALTVKRKIDDATKDLPEARVDFRIMNMGRPRV